MKFSIIIPNYNEANDIAATLEALLALYYADKEILVVDDSSDRTPEYDTDEQALSLIKKMFKDIFERELGGFCTDPDYWPSKRDFKTFLKWFDIELHSEVFDTIDEEIIKKQWD